MATGLHFNQDDRKHRNNVSFKGGNWVRLSCGCDTLSPPKLSNPERWWCCGAWRKKVQAR